MKHLKRFRTLVFLGCVVTAMVAWPVWRFFTSPSRQELDGRLLTAVNQGQVEEVRAALKAGADPNVRDLTWAKPESPWEHFKAFFTGRHNSEFERAPTALSCTWEFRILHHNAPTTEIMKLLLDYGADTKLADQGIRPPLYLAEQAGDTQIIQLLLNHGQDPNVQFQSGPTQYETALRLAISTADVATVRSLLDHGARIEWHKDKYGMNDLDAARYYAQSRPEYKKECTQIIALLTNATRTNTR